MLRFVVFDAEAVNNVDSTALLMLQQLIESFNQQGIAFYISNAIGPVRDTIKNSSLHSYMSEDSMFATIQDAMSFIDNGSHINTDAALQTNNN